MDLHRPEPMPALSVRQPWLHCITDIPRAEDPKRTENRTWKPPAKVLGKQIALHVSKAKSYPMIFTTLEMLGLDTSFSVEDMVFGAIVATSVVVGYVQPARYFDDALVWASSWNGPRDYDPTTDRWYAYGQYGWLLRDVRKLAEPIPHRGMLGLWKIDAEKWGTARYA